MIITIDGPSGTGKTTVAKRVAQRLNFVYFDTGAMYRAFTWMVLEHHVDLQDESMLKALLDKFLFRIHEQKGEKRYFVGERDVTEVIRSQPVTSHVSAVSALKMVRGSLLHWQHDFSQGCNVVFEGRDLGTVVFPQAEFKIFLDADPVVRAERRLAEMMEKNPEIAKSFDQQSMVKELNRRDTIDSTRETAPLRCPPDAYQIDTSQLSIDQVVEQIVLYVQRQLQNSPTRKNR